jgi:hypothetical protein
MLDILFEERRNSKLILSEKGNNYKVNNYEFFTVR